MILDAFDVGGLSGFLFHGSHGDEVVPVGETVFCPPGWGPVATVGGVCDELDRSGSDCVGMRNQSPR